MFELKVEQDMKQPEWITKNTNFLLICINHTIIIPYIELNADIDLE